MSTGEARDQMRSGAGTYRFLVGRDADDPRFWLAHWSADDRVHTFGRSLAEVEEMARDAVALWLHVDVDSVEVTLEVDLPEDVDAEIAELSRLRGELDSVQGAVVRRQRDLARHLVQNEGMTYRDAARLLGLSHQRIAQLVRESA